jgi:leucine dehydrogenase
VTERRPDAPKPELHVWRDPDAGLHAVIAIDDPARLPAVGGCRMWPYGSEAAAIEDALLLARAMSLKCAAAGLPFGGGKAAIIGDPARDKTPELLRAFGRMVERLGGRYVTAEDVGISVTDLDVVARETRHVAGRSPDAGSSGDPSPLTARGVLVGMRAGLVELRGNDALSGVRVAVQGLGQVGFSLCRLLHEEGASLVVADLDRERVERACHDLGARAATPDEIVFQDVDVLAPCALGGVIDAQAVPKLRARLIAGAANNVLADPSLADRLTERGILYAPDYLINAGGILHIAAELLGHDTTWVDDQIQAIGPRIRAAVRDQLR